MNSSTNSDLSTVNRVRNFLVAIVAIALTVALYIGFQTNSTTPTLSKMAEDSIPLTVALTNGQPSLVEFYADWCTTCQAMAPDMASLKQVYGPKINFVMLNVDNDKWLPELAKYKVDGIPHWLFFNGQAELIGQNIGEVPRQVMANNLDALIAGQTLPNIQVKGQFSDLTQSNTQANTVSNPTDPRAHGR